MLFKLALSILIITSGILSGYLKAKTLDQRVSRLQELITLITLLEAEMKYRLDPLPDLLLQTGGTREWLGAIFFRNVGLTLKCRNDGILSEIWEEAVDTVYCSSTLTPEDLNLLKDMGKSIGHTDTEHQSALFGRTLELLNLQLDEAQAEKRTKGKVYQSIGTATGVMIVIVLL